MGLLVRRWCDVLRRRGNILGRPLSGPNVRPGNAHKPGVPGRLMLSTETEGALGQPLVFGPPPSRVIRPRSTRSHLLACRHPSGLSIVCFVFLSSYRTSNADTYP